MRARYRAAAGQLSERLCQIHMRALQVRVQLRFDVSDSFAEERDRSLDARLYEGHGWVAALKPLRLDPVEIHEHTAPGAEPTHSSLLGRGQGVNEAVPLG
ncbi:MAG: hypothetical protein N3C12_04210 [Candidatus Binatia bacterium]|nr:hypothetical protein [Candidatus Binatia bacterium]